MGKINILDKHIAELIAAGEVVERPSSVIKELAENSIDAGAKNVTIEIKNGGKTYMRVTDDGKGIEKEDVKNAFLRNATSKIKLEDDLDRISTLGFRGEALASICAVSEVELITRPENEEIGTRYEIFGGEEVSFSEYGCPQGTTIIVRNLFYNTPARMKFLKKDVAESNSIAKVLNMIALSHPEVSIKFIKDGKLEINTPGDGKVKSSIYAVYGNNFTSSLIEISYTLNGIIVDGFISRPGAARPNRSMQHFFINGRYVKTRTAMVALEEAYKGSIMVQKFPASVIYINVPFDVVDVNVHPSKIEVRFADERPIFDAVYHGTKTALLREDKPAIMSFCQKEIRAPFAVEKSCEKNEIWAGLQKVEVKIDGAVDKKSYKIDEMNEGTGDGANVKISIKKGYDRLGIAHDEPEIFLPKHLNDFKRIPESNIISTPGNETVISIKNTPNPYIVNEHDEVLFMAQPPKNHTEQIADLCEQQMKIDGFKKGEDDFKVIGEAFKTYIMVQRNDNELLLVDKHALHERMIYEKLKLQKSEESAQTLLEPVVVSVSKEEQGAILSNINAMEKAGFDIEDFGAGALIVRSAPLYLKHDEIEDTVAQMAEHILQDKKDITTDHVEWLYQNIACRAAIKAGADLKIEEMVDLMKQTDGEKHCPHGRPIFVIISKKDIEKQFGRIK